MVAQVESVHDGFVHLSLHHNSEHFAGGETMVGWSWVHLNLPGSAGYDPQLPWVSRVTEEGKLTSSVPRYVDGMRTVGNSAEHCWQVCHWTATIFSYLGTQIAAWKTCPPSQQPGPWAGTIVFVCMAGIGITCVPEKWEKAEMLRT